MWFTVVPSPSSGKKAPPPPPPSRGQPGPVYATALYDYEGQSEYELSFYAGDVITVTDEDSGGTGWWQGELNGYFGAFPGNYVEKQ